MTALDSWHCQHLRIRDCIQEDPLLSDRAENTQIWNKESVLYIFHFLTEVSIFNLKLRNGWTKPRVPSFLPNFSTPWSNYIHIQIRRPLLYRHWRRDWRPIEWRDLEKLPKASNLRLLNKLKQQIQQKSQRQSTMETTSRQPSSWKNRDVAKPASTPISFTAPSRTHRLHNIRPYSPRSLDWVTMERFKKIIKLSGRDVLLPKESENVLFNQCCNLYRYDDGKLRHIVFGQLKLLRKTHSN